MSLCNCWEKRRSKRTAGEKALDEQAKKPKLPRPEWAAEPGLPYIRISIECVDPDPPHDDLDSVDIIVPPDKRVAFMDFLRKSGIMDS